MSSIAFDEAEIAWKAVAEFARESSRSWGTGTRMDQLDRPETLERSLPAMRHQLINELVEPATVKELGGSLARAMGDRRWITRAEGSRRIEEAAELWNDTRSRANRCRRGSRQQRRRS